MDYAFQLINLNKKYKEFELGPLNLELDPGVVLGYVGPNGSGKTTTMHCMMNLVKPDDGRIIIFGRENDPNKVEWKHDVGYVGDAHVFYESASVKNNLEMFSRFYPSWDNKWVDELVRRFDVPLNKSAKQLSAGNRVKLSLITAMAYHPRLLVLDEPTSHLDPLVRAEVLDVFYEVMESAESAIFYSTHILTDIARLADKLAFLHDGNLTATMSTVDLQERWRKLSVRRRDLPKNIAGAERVRSSDLDHEIITSDHEATMNHLKELGISDIHMLRMSLEDISVEILRKVRDESLKKKGITA
jgi:ABC-2 type transport system ATP-binding protein